jgi:hypothetical protein
VIYALTLITEQILRVFWKVWKKYVSLLGRLSGVGVWAVNPSTGHFPSLAKLPSRLKI